MNTNTKQKEKGVIVHWNEARQFGFVAQRMTDGQRLTYFLHSNQIETIETVGGIPQLNDTVYFHIQPNAKGPVAVHAEVVARAYSFNKLAGAR
jgi:cold shock CspA family protein